MDIQVAKYLYMLAHLRRYCAVNPASWSADDVVSTYNTLREPDISLVDWVTRMGIELKDFKEEANAAAIAIIKASDDPAVKKD